MTKKTKKQPAFKERLRAWRKSKGITREQAAEILGIEYRTLEGWEQGKRGVRIDSIVGTVEQLLKDGF